MNGLVAKFYSPPPSEQLSMSFVLEVRFPSLEQSKVFKAIFVMCLFAASSFIFVINAKLVHGMQPYPTTMKVTNKMHCID